MDLTPREQFARILRTQVAPALKAHGFRRREQTFTRRIGDAWVVASLQKSMYHQPDREISFAVNLGVKNAWLARFRDEDIEREPRIADCHLAERLGPAQAGQDQWWLLDRETSADTRVGEKVARSLIEVGVPFLERIATNEGLRDWLRKGHRQAQWRDLAVLYRVVGPADKLDRVLAEQRHRYKFNPARLQEIDAHEERLARFARDHGL